MSLICLFKSTFTFIPLFFMYYLIIHISSLTHSLSLSLSFFFKLMYFFLVLIFICLICIFWNYFVSSNTMCSLINWPIQSTALLYIYTFSAYFVPFLFQDKIYLHIIQERKRKDRGKRVK